jgi:hypothetical protein
VQQVIVNIYNYFFAFSIQPFEFGHVPRLDRLLVDHCVVIVSGGEYRYGFARGITENVIRSHYACGEKHAVVRATSRPTKQDFVRFQNPSNPA